MKLNEIKNEKQLKKHLGIDSWNQLSKEKFVDFIKLLPNTNPEVLKLTLEQIPMFVELSKESLSIIENIGKEVLKGDRENAKEFRQMCHVYQKALNKCLEHDDLKFEDKKVLLQMMHELLVMVERKDTHDRQFFYNIIKIILGSCSFVAIIFLKIIFPDMDVSKFKFWEK